MNTEEQSKALQAAVAKYGGVNWDHVAGVIIHAAIAWLVFRALDYLKNKV